MAKRWKRLTPRQMAALRKRVDKRLKAEAESATGIVAWRLVSVLLTLLVHRKDLDHEEVEIMISAARDGIWESLPSAKTAQMMLDLELADWQSKGRTKH